MVFKKIGELGKKIGQVGKDAGTAVSGYLNDKATEVRDKRESENKEYNSFDLVKDIGTIASDAIETSAERIRKIRGEFELQNNSFLIKKSVTGNDQERSIAKNILKARERAASDQDL